jgi:hypothetical protein
LRAVFVLSFHFRSVLLKKSQFQRNYFFVLRELSFTEYVNPNTSRGRNLLMTRSIFAAVLALAAFGFVPMSINVAHAYDTTVAGKPRIDIPRIKNVLHLTPEQQAYWPPVEAALRTLARHPVAEQPIPQNEGLFQRVSNRVYAYAVDAATLARVGAAVRPLVKVLDDRQKNDAIALCQEMGLGQVLAALI